MSSRRFAILALAISLILHWVLFWFASRITLDRQNMSLEVTPKEAQQMQMVTLDDLPEVPPKEDTFKPSWDDGKEFNPPEFQTISQLTPEEQRTLEALDDAKKLLEESIAAEPPVDLYQLGQLPQEKPTAIASSIAMALPEEALQVTAPRIDILQIKAEELPAERLSETRLVIPEVARDFVPSNIQIPSFAAAGELSGPAPAANITSIDTITGRPNFGLNNADLVGLYDQPPAGPALPPGNPFDLDKPKGKTTLPTLTEARFPLDAYVTVSVSTYPDPAGPGGTFLVELRPAPKSNTMPDIPKDVLFIVDRSSSISYTKFQQFKKAVQEVLPALSGEDRFNLISFNDKQRTVFTDFVSASAANIAEAQKHVNGLPHGGRTDVFRSVAPFVKKSNGQQNRPLNIFLLTDGQSTVNVYKESDFLRQISGINPGNVSIFPFSAEKKANRMLLDFLGYLNKGEQRHVETTDEICDAMVRFYSDHSNLIVTDLRCAATSGADVNEVFPRSLPHLYRRQTLRLFGRYQNKADTLTLSLMGRDAEGRLRDLIFTRKFDQCPLGADTLPAQWAAQKVFFLIARLNLSENPAEKADLQRRIDELKKQYSLLSPY